MGASGRAARSSNVGASLPCVTTKAICARDSSSRARGCRLCSRTVRGGGARPGAMPARRRFGWLALGPAGRRSRRRPAACRRIGRLPLDVGNAGNDGSVGQVDALGFVGPDGDAVRGQRGGGALADPSWQDIRPVLRPVQTHRLVAQVQHGAVPQQHSVGRTCQHDAAGARGSCDRGDDQVSGAGEDLPTHVVDGNDVVPGLAGWVLHGLDDTQMDAGQRLVRCRLGQQSRVGTRRQRSGGTGSARVERVPDRVPCSQKQQPADDDADDL